MTEPILTEPLPTIEVPEPKVQITLRLDKEIVDYYRKTGRLWQSRINADLAFIVRQREAAAPSPTRRRTKATR